MPVESSVFINNIIKYIQESRNLSIRVQTALVTDLLQHRAFSGVKKVRREVVRGFFSSHCSRIGYTFTCDFSVVV